MAEVSAAMRFEPNWQLNKDMPMMSRKRPPVAGKGDAMRTNHAPESGFREGLLTVLSLRGVVDALLYTVHGSPERELNNGIARLLNKAGDEARIVQGLGHERHERQGGFRQPV